MESKILEGVKPFNEMSLKSCYYNQMVAGYSAFGIEPEIIVGNFLPLYQFDEQDKSLEIINSSVFTDRELYSFTGIKKKYYKKVNNLEKFLIKKIDKNCPIILPVDGFYLKYREDIYRKQHGSHFVLVYGYDKTNKKFIINEHWYANDKNYRERKVEMEVIIKSYNNFVDRLMKNKSFVLTVLIKKHKARQKFIQQYNIKLLNNQSDLENSKKNFNKCIYYILESLKDKDILVKEQDTIIDFLCEIRSIKLVQKNVLNFVFNDEKLNKILERIVENYIFIYGIMVKIKMANFNNEKSIEKTINRCIELRELEEKLHNFLIRGKL